MKEERSREGRRGADQGRTSHRELNRCCVLHTATSSIDESCKGETGRYCSRGEVSEAPLVSGRGRINSTYNLGLVAVPYSSTTPTDRS
jgi:hypothetical protein